MHMTYYFEKSNICGFKKRNLHAVVIFDLGLVFYTNSFCVGNRVWNWWKGLGQRFDKFGLPCYLGSNCRTNSLKFNYYLILICLNSYQCCLAFLSNLLMLCIFQNLSVMFAYIIFLLKFL